MQTENNTVAAHRETECECVWVEKCNVKHAVQMYVCYTCFGTTD